MMMKYYELKKDIKLYYSKNLSMLFIKTYLGSICTYMPSMYFVKDQLNKISFLFGTKKDFNKFLVHLFNLYNSLYNFYYIKIKIRGLGYKIRQIEGGLFYIFFNYTNFYYCYAPSELIIVSYKKRLLMVSMNWQMLKLILSEILLLKSMATYRLRGIRVARQFILLRKRKMTK